MNFRAPRRKPHREASASLEAADEASTCAPAATADTAGGPWRTAKDS